MRIIAGTAGRSTIKVPPNVTRPTTDFVRQAIFSILGSTVEGARVLDLYAGSGAIGLEALSRGAASCTFVDEHPRVCATIAQNLKTTRLSGGHIERMAVANFLKKSHATFDLIFADPPYCKTHGDPDHLAELFSANLLAPRLATPESILTIELSADQPAPLHGEDFLQDAERSTRDHRSRGTGACAPLTLLTRRTYGSTAICLYQPTVA